MKIFNGKVLIAGNGKICKDWFSKARGLMFSSGLKKGQALILVADKESVMESSIHMLFVFQWIDVVWLDRNKNVVDFKRNVKPFTILIMPKKPAKYVVELPKGGISNINIGDNFIF